MQRNISLFLTLNLLLFTIKSLAQCCSPGNPVGGTANLGIMNEKSLKVMASYRYSYSGKYMRGNELSEPYFVKTGYFKHTGFLLAFALSDRITVQMETGYFFNKTQTYVDGILPEKKQGYGLTNIVLIPKINLLKKNNWEVTTGLGLKYPVGPYNKSFNGALAELDIQPSTGAVDYIFTMFVSKEYLSKHLRFFFFNRAEVKKANTQLYKYGNLYATSFFVSYSTPIRLDFILQIRNEIRSRDQRPSQIKPYSIQKISISGSKKVFITPQINYSISQTFNLSILADFPVYQYYNQEQLANTFSVSMSIAKKFR